MTSRLARRIGIGLFVILGVLAIWSRWRLLDISLWVDEAYTAQFYVARGPAAIFRPESYLLNNHVFFSLGEWIGTRLFGESELVLRLGAFIPAMGAIALLGVWATRRFGYGVGLGVVALLVASPIHLLYATQARGYGLGILVAAVLLVAGVATDERPSRASWIWLGAAGAVGAATLPHLGFLYGAHLLALARHRARWRGILINGAVVAAATVGFYRRLLGEIIDETTGQGLLRSLTDRPDKVLSIPEFVTEPAGLLYSLWTRSFGVWPDWVVDVSFVALLALGGWALWRRRDSAAVAQLFGVWLAVMVVLFVIGSIPRQRFLSFMIGPIAVIIAVGLADLVRLVVKPRIARIAAGVALSAFLISWMLSSASMWQDPWENYREAVAVAQSYDREIVSNRAIGAAGFLWYDDSIVAADDVAALCEKAEPFVLVDFPFRPEELPTCIADLATERREVSQRRDPGAIVIWVMPGAAGNG